MEIICINHKPTRMPHGKYPDFAYLTWSENSGAGRLGRWLLFAGHVWKPEKGPAKGCASPHGGGSYLRHQNFCKKRIHGTGIFTYMKTIKINHPCIGTYTIQFVPWILWVQYNIASVVSGKLVKLAAPESYGIWMGDFRGIHSESKPKGILATFFGRQLWLMLSWQHLLVNP